VRIVAAAAEPAWIDPDRIFQVLSNLISNAAKYGWPDSEIRIASEARGDEIEVAVGNRGPGIPPDEQRRLFGRFSRAPGGGRGRAPGLGLGLYISKGLVEAHGGRLWVESAPDDWTTFRFTVPRLPPTAEMQPPAPA
jgi:signal transduction histidine kinase